MSLIDAEFAARFARDWAQAWNDHDLDAILGAYAEDVEFHSPRIRVVTGRPVDSVVGKTALRDYWSRALEMGRDLYFEVDQVFAGSDTLTIVYTNHRSQTVAETLVFDGKGRVRRGYVAYA
ncbi:MAG: nuclear transport factor 2 family protein [Alphaproteobacteria bacterium]|nr:nuclear transport factor 2 family protein [Alphaproteobacteria bacterium]